MKSNWLMKSLITFFHDIVRNQLSILKWIGFKKLEFHQNSDTFTFQCSELSNIIMSLPILKTIFCITATWHSNFSKQAELDELVSQQYIWMWRYLSTDEAAGRNRSYWNPSILIDFTLKYKSSSCFLWDRQPDQTPVKNRVHLVCRVSDNLPNAQGECPMTPFCIRTVNLSDSVSIIAFFLPEIEMRGKRDGPALRAHS